MTSPVTIQVRPPSSPAPDAASNALLLTTASPREGGAPSPAAGAVRIGPDGKIYPDPQSATPVEAGQWLDVNGWGVKATDPDAATWSSDAALPSVHSVPGWAQPELVVVTCNGRRPRDPMHTSLPMRDGAQVAIGRHAQQCDLVLHDPHVSARHARIFVRDGRVLVEDLGSKWGTWVDGAELHEASQLHHGQIIVVGQSRIRFTSYLESAVPAPPVGLPLVEDAPSEVIAPPPATVGPMPASPPVAAPIFAPALPPGRAPTMWRTYVTAIAICILLVAAVLHLGRFVRPHRTPAPATQEMVP